MEELNSYDQLNQTRQAMERVVAVIAEVAGETDPFKIFPNPKDFPRRADIVWGISLSPEQEASFREEMSELGPGRRSDVGPIDVGFENQDHALVLEGGQPHKVIAQLRVARSGGRSVLPTAIYQTASVDRVIGKNEIGFMAKYLNCDEEDVATTELGMVEQIIRHEADFEAWPGDNQTMPVAELSEKAEGLIMEPYLAGHFSNPNPNDTEDTAPVNVFIVGLKRHYHEDDPKKYDQPSNADKIAHVIGLSANNNIGFATSSLYQPSNVVMADALRFETGSNIQIISYGIENLAEVKGTDPAAPYLPDLAAEAYNTALLLQKA